MEFVKVIGVIISIKWGWGREGEHLAVMREKRNAGRFTVEKFEGLRRFGRNGGRWKYI